MGIAAVHWLNGKPRIEFPLGTVLLDPGVLGRSWIEFSPDGRLLLFDSDAKGLVVTDLHGKQTVVARKVPGYGLHWRPKGREILGFYPNKGATDVFAIPLGGDRRLLVTWPGEFYFYDAAPDGRLLVKKVLNTHPVFARLPAETSDRQLHLMNGSEPVDLSDDGKTLLFTVYDAASGDKGAVYIGGMDGSPAKRLTQGFALGLSRDGKFALCYASEGLVLVPTGAGLPRPLGPNQDEDFDEAGFHPDGRQIWFNTRGTTGDGRCFRQSMEGGERRPVAPDGLTCGAFSPDGKWALVTGTGHRARFQGTVTKYQTAAGRRRAAARRAGPRSGREARPLVE